MGTSERAAGLTGRAEQRLQEIREQGLLRQLAAVRHSGGGRIVVDGRDYLNLSGNDYLGLADNPELLREFYSTSFREDDLQAMAPGAGASRLLSGNHHQYGALEQRLSALYQRQVLLFNSGYHANIGILPALTTRDDLILADKLCHASLIDGMRLSRAEVIRFPHNDYERLAALLAAKRRNCDQCFLVTESVFSMDGDLADLNRLVALKKDYDCCLYVDEAHAVGVLGEQGLGLAAQQGVSADIDLLLGTFGKAWGAQGAFVACNTAVADYLVNTARSLIFSTGLPPVTLSWLLFLADRLPAMEDRRRHLARLAAQLREALRTAGLQSGGHSHIIPVAVGESARSLAVALRLREQGFWLSAIRPPTVPRGTSRLRISLSAAMQWSDLAGLPQAIVLAMQRE